MENMPEKFNARADEIFKYLLSGLLAVAGVVAAYSLLVDAKAPTEQSRVVGSIASSR